MTNQDAIEWLISIDKKYIHGGDECFDEHRHEAINLAIKALGEIPKGKWIELPKSINDNELPCECSICGHVLGFYYGYPKSNFCPNCGADMRGEG